MVAAGGAGGNGADGLGLYVGGVLLQGCHRVVIGGEVWTRRVGDWVMVEGHQTGRLGDPLGGPLGGGCRVVWRVK